MLCEVGNLNKNIVIRGKMPLREDDIDD